MARFMIYFGSYCFEKSPCEYINYGITQSQKLYRPASA